MADAMALSVAAGWNQTAADWQFLLNNGDNTGVVAMVNHKIVGSAMMLDYEKRIGWVCMVLVHTAYRGRGIGSRLLQHVLGNGGMPLRLDATKLGEPVYRKFDFKNEYGIVRMVNSCVGDILCSTPKGVPGTSRHFDAIVQQDAATFGARREKLITYLLKNYPAQCLVLEAGERPVAFVLGREGLHYHHIGPVVADTAEQADALVTATLLRPRNKPAVIDVVSDKESLIKKLTAYGFTKQRNFLRMQRGNYHLPETPDRLYAIAGPEFG